MAEQETIAVLGAGGIMGLPIARNLARAGFPVRAWNRTAGKAAPLAEDGAVLCASPAEAADGAAVIVTMLSDADTVLRAMNDALNGACEDAVWLQMSTIGEGGTERCADLAADRGLRFVDAPVLGTKAPAEQGELVILAAGGGPLRERLEPIFDTVGGRTMWLGSAGEGSRLKLATNSWVLTVVEGCAETLAFAEGLGVDPGLVLEAVKGGALDLPYLQLKGKAILERAWEPSFRLELAAKDAQLMQSAAAHHNLDLPLIRTISARLAEGVDAHGDKDMSATYLTSAGS